MTFFSDTIFPRSCNEYNVLIFYMRAFVCLSALSGPDAENLPGKGSQHGHPPLILSDRRPKVTPAFLSRRDLYKTGVSVDTLCKRFRSDCRSVDQDVDGKVGY